MISPLFILFYNYDLPSIVLGLVAVSVVRCHLRIFRLGSRGLRNEINLSDYEPTRLCKRQTNDNIKVTDPTTTYLICTSYLLMYFKKLFVS